MTAPSHDPAASSKVLARVAVVGMFLAVVALGALAIWAAIISQNAASGLSQAGIQTSGHLRALQALSMLDTSTDALEKGPIPVELANVRVAQRVLDDALHRMANGEVPDARRIAAESTPIVRRLKPAIELFLATPPGYDSNGSSGPEEAMEKLISELEVVLNDLEADPSRLLTTKLGAVSATERTVRITAFVLIPLGLMSVAACAWLLSLYRRRAEATMRSALVETAREARTDELTGLPNRRALLEELARRSNENLSFTLSLADLNGFKRYNDTFGHPAGDALLRRLGRNLAAACDGRGIAARLGGDEFCVLLDGVVPVDETHAMVHAALSDEGPGFRITSSAGVVSVPGETRDPSAALRLADTRMYAAKIGANRDPEERLSGVLTRMLDARHPGLANHAEEVAELAGACGEALGMPAADVRSVQRAAELHDLGKVAIPSAILTKEAALSHEESVFMRRHPVIGERILTGVPSLRQIALIVRSSHERWDGTGDPDRLRGAEISMGARIIFVADAYCAMTEERPYASARSIESAREELRACAGSQFDPAVVEAFLAVLDARGAPALDETSLALAAQL